MEGLHLTADLRDCDPGCAALIDASVLRGACLSAVEASGLQAVGELFHAFPRAAGPVPEGMQRAPAGGVTGVVLLAESHLAVHTWPELRAVTLDVYVCNLGADNTGRARHLLDALLGVFDARQVERHALARGGALPSPSPPRSAASSFSSPPSSSSTPP